jgi:hypothetical protein
MLGWRVANTLNKQANQQQKSDHIPAELDLNENLLQDATDETGFENQLTHNNEQFGATDGSAETQSLKLSHLFGEISSLAEAYLSDWSLSLGSLEDVFLSVVRKYRESNIIGEI